MSDLRKVLLDLRDKKGSLTPPIVVAAAKSPRSPLHEHFDWEDQVAADLWRLEQARQLMRRCRVVYREAGEDEPERSVRAFHAVRGPTGTTWEPAEEVAEDPVMREIVLRDMERDWRALHRRYAEFEEFSAMVLADLDDEREAA